MKQLSKPHLLQIHTVHPIHWLNIKYLYNRNASLWDSLQASSTLAIVPRKWNNNANHIIVWDWRQKSTMKKTVKTTICHNTKRAYWERHVQLKRISHCWLLTAAMSYTEYCKLLTISKGRSFLPKNVDLSQSKPFTGLLKAVHRRTKSD